MGSLRVHLPNDVLASFSFFHKFDGCASEQIHWTFSDFEEIQTTRWKSHLVVQRNGAKQEQVPQFKGKICSHTGPPCSGML